MRCRITSRWRTRVPQGWDADTTRGKQLTLQGTAVRLKELLKQATE